MTDADGDAVTLSAIDLPAGASIGSDNVLRWEPQGFQAGNHTIRLIADDGLLQARRTLTLVASFQPAGPQVTIVTTPSFPATPGQDVIIEPIADSDVAIESTTLRIDGAPVTLDELGRAVFVAETPGRYEVSTTVTDVEGRSTTVTQPLFIRDPGDRTAPRIEITEFAPPVVTGTRELMFDIFDDGLAQYQVDLISRGSGNRTTIGSGETSIVQFVNLEPERFANGFYTISITATDFGGLTSTETFDIEINSTTKSAAVQQSATDLSVTLDGISVDFSRFYDSLQPESTGFFSTPLINPQIALGGDSNADSFDAMRAGTRLYVSLPTGERVGFTFQPSATAAGIETYKPAWVADEGVAWGLDSFDATLQIADGRYYIVGSGLPYVPAVVEEGEEIFTLVAPDGQRYGFVSVGETTSGLDYRLNRITAAGGETSLRFTDSALVAPSGDRLSIIRDADGRISELVGSDGQHFVYRYDTAGRLSIAIDAVGGERTFHGYDDEGRLSVVAPTDVEGTLFRYDETGAPLPAAGIAPHLGGTREIFAGALGGTLADGVTDHYALTVTEGELRSSPTGSITIGIETTSGDFDPADATLAGLAPSNALMSAGRSVTLFTISEAGTYALGITGGTGTYTADLYLVGDVNADNIIDADDATLFATALGSTAGGAEYNVSADADRDGDVDGQDEDALLAAFGFIANRSPVLIDDATLTFESIVGQSLILDVNQLFEDPENDAGFARVGGVSDNLSVRRLGSDLLSLTTTSNAPGSESATLSLDDGLLSAAGSLVNVEFVQAGFQRLEFSQQDLTLGSSDVTQLRVLGIDADGNSVPVQSSQIVFGSIDTETVLITDTGVLIAGNAGTTVITATAFGLTTATAVSVSTLPATNVDFFPDAYTLTLDQTRDFLVRRRVGDTIEELDGDDGVVYVLSDPTLATIDDQGRLDPLAAGKLWVTTIYAGTSSVAPILIEPTTSTSIGTGGGVAEADGIVVTVPPGALDETISIGLSAATEAELPYVLPEGWDFDAGVRIDLDERLLDQPLSLDFPAPADAVDGEQRFLIMPIDVFLDDGSTESSWMLVDSLEVSGGRVKTTSPPNIGAGSRRYFDGGSFRPSPGGLFALSSPSILGTVAAIGEFGARLQNDAILSADVVGAGGDPNRRLYVIDGPLGSMQIPIVANIDYQLRQLQPSNDGLVEVGTSLVRVDAATTFNLVLPQPPRFVSSVTTPPQLSGGKVEFTPDGTKLRLTGANFVLEPIYAAASDLGSEVEDLYVTMEIGARDIFDENGDPKALGGADYRIDGSMLELDGEDLLVTIPPNTLIGPAFVTVTRPYEAPVDGQFIRQEITSNPVRFAPVDSFVFVASTREDSDSGQDTISVIDTGATTDLNLGVDDSGEPVIIPKRQPAEFARIPVSHAEDGEEVRRHDAPRKLKHSADGTLVYVTLERSAAVAVVDAIALHQIDVIQDEEINDDDTPAERERKRKTLGVQAIELPEGARPFDMTVDPRGRYLFVSDFHRNAVYVIDADPFSSKYHTVIQTFALPTFPGGPADLAPVGLRGMAVSDNGRRLSIATPVRDLFRGAGSRNGYVVNVQIDADNRTTEEDVDEEVEPESPGPLSVDEKDPTSWVEVGPAPYDIATTEDPNVIQVVDRVADNMALTIITFGKDASGMNTVDPSPISFNGFGIIPRFVEGRSTQAFGVSNAQSVVHIPADTFSDLLIEEGEELGPHPAYSVVVGFNRFIPFDPKHDPNIGPFEAYNPTFRVDDRVPSFNVAAGGNLGIVRNTLGDHDDPEERPRIVAATTPIPQGFPDALAFVPNNGQVVASFTTAGFAATYDMGRIIARIEAEVRQADEEGPLDVWAQFPETNEITDSLSHLLRGELSTIPIDELDRTLATGGDVRFFRNLTAGADNSLMFGVPPVGPLNETPNQFAPLAIPRGPRGASAADLQRIESVVQLQPTPYNQQPVVAAGPDGALKIPTGKTSTAEVHTGALMEMHELVQYQSQGETRGLQLHYDSLRAESAADLLLRCRQRV